MKSPITKIGIISVLLAIAMALAGFSQSPGFVQDVLVGLSTTFFGVGLGVVVINYYLTSVDKKSAAGPISKLIAPNIAKLHNELFIKHLIKELGKEEMSRLLGIYQKHKGQPNAFSPSDRDILYDAIVPIRKELSDVYDALHEQMKEVTLLLGWTYDTAITAAALTARLSYGAFKSAAWDGSVEDKLKVIEAYLDSEGATSTVYSKLQSHLGLKDSEWKEDP